jgi:demethylmenaquinone methyltransferase/2-methoxy-6-polyprenyl-1,4-benzoquinol methylase
MNDVMSAGTHRLWKDTFVNMIGIESCAKIKPDFVPRFLDVAGGTGDIAFRIASELNKHYGVSKFTQLSEKQVVVADINPEMLAVGASRAPTKLASGLTDALDFVEANAEQLPFPDASFDVYTIAFGLRNVTNKDVALAEAFRILRPGGRLMILEFSEVNVPGVKQLYDYYSMNVIPHLGRVVANDEDSYRYLVESIRRFPKQPELQEMVQSAGFTGCNYTNLTFGAVAIHSGFKIN